MIVLKFVDFKEEEKKIFCVFYQGFRRIPNRRAFRPLRRFNNTNRPNRASHDYLLKIVPTIYEDLRQNRLYPYQFTFFYRVSKQIDEHVNYESIFILQNKLELLKTTKSSYL